MSESGRQAKPPVAQLHRALGLWDVILFNVVAIVGLRWLSTAAQTGPASLMLWVLAMVVFFVPSAFAVMELSTRIPGEGGIYQWSKQAFGDFHGFLAGWAYWVNNLVYFPSLLLFVSGSFLYLGGGDWLGLENSAWYNAGFSLVVLWIALGLNIVGLERGKWVQNIGGASTWIVAVLLVGLGLVAWFRHGSATALDSASLVPDLSTLPTITFFATMTFGFAGLELAPIMGDEIRDPRRTLTRAMVVSGVVIAAVYIVGTAALLVAVPTEQVNIITGIPQALAVMGERIGIPGVERLGALLITIAGVGGLGAWLTGTARIPFVVGVDKFLPPALGRVHPKWGTPHVALLVQGVLATILLLVAVAGSTIEEAYVVLLDMTIVLYFIPFVYLFVALPVLRRKNVGGDDVFRIPGGSPVVLLTAGLGLAATVLSIVLSLMPPAGAERPGMFLLKVVGGCAMFLMVGVVFFLRGTRKNRVANARTESGA